MAFLNLDFSTTDGTPGGASGWIWTRLAPFLFAGHATAGGDISHAEGFEFGWGCDTLVVALVVPSNAQPAVFDATTAPSPAEGFERGWEGNETAQFAWSGGQAVDFSVAQVPPAGHPFDGFEAGWPSNETFFWTFAPVPRTPAIFAIPEIGPSGLPFENFEQGWLRNEVYAHTFPPGVAATFQGGAHAFESFAAVKADQAIVVNSSTDTIACVGHGFANGDTVTIYAGPATPAVPQGGILPVPISPAVRYTIANKTNNTFQLEDGNGVLVSYVSPGQAPLFVKADTSLWWTQTNVGI